MKNLLLRFSRFVGQLKRRHVVRVAIGYAVVSFVLLQAADIIFDALRFPTDSMTVLTVILILGAPLALMLAWAFDVTPEGIKRTPPDEDTPARAASPVAPQQVDRAVGVRARGPSVAVLPFVNMSGSEDNEYFSQGITEEIIVALSRVRELKVISRTSTRRFRDAAAPVREIARELGVATVLEGSVRRSEERVRIVAQLIDGETEAHIWVETYDRALASIFDIQLDVARRITEALRGEIMPADERRLAPVRTRDVQAYDLYLKGRYLWNKRTEDCLRRSLGYFEQALERDPEFAGALSGIADSRTTLGIYGLSPPHETMPLARQAADRALSLAPELGAALTSRACVRSIYEWDWHGAEEDFRRALEVEPQYATAHHWYAINLLAPLGRIEQADFEAAEARRLDPLNAAINTTIAWLAGLRGDPQEGVRQCRAVIEVESSFPLAHFFLGQLLQQTGDAAAAEASLERAVTLSERSPETLGALAYAYGCNGKEARARALLGELEELSAQRFVSGAVRAQVHLALDERAAALDLLEQARDQRAPDMIWLATRPAYRPLAGEPRFQRLLTQVGLQA